MAVQGEERAPAGCEEPCVSDRSDTAPTRYRRLGSSQAWVAKGSEETSAVQEEEEEEGRRYTPTSVGVYDFCLKYVTQSSWKGTEERAVCYESVWFKTPPPPPPVFLFVSLSVSHSCVSLVRDVCKGCVTFRAQLTSKKWDWCFFFTGQVSSFPLVKS